MELKNWSRKKSSIVNFVFLTILSIPCVLGFNLINWDALNIFGGTILDLEDFIVSNVLLPLGALVYLLLCVTKYGWGWNNFKAEANEGKGIKVKNWMRVYLTYILPFIIIFIFGFGIYDKFFK